MQIYILIYAVEIIELGEYKIVYFVHIMSFENYSNVWADVL